MAAAARCVDCAKCNKHAGRHAWLQPACMAGWLLVLHRTVASHRGCKAAAAAQPYLRSSIVPPAVHVEGRFAPPHWHWRVA
eukprot:COSAG01_NODE_2597_length_7400_cov_37.453363_9_plen_81_part_00